MKTTYYITYESRSTNGARRTYESKHYEEGQKAQELFHARVKMANTIEAHLIKEDIYTDPNEIPFETTTNRRPYGWVETNVISSYNPKFFGGIKIWDK